MRLSLKILLPALLSLLLLAGMSGFIVYSLQLQQRSLQDTGRQLLASDQLVGELRQQRTAIETHLLLYLQNSKQSSLDAIADADRGIAGAVNAYLLRPTDSRTTSQLQAFLESHDAIVRTRREMIRSHAAKDAQRVRLLTDKWAIQRERVDANLRDLRALGAIQTEATLKDAAQAQDWMKQIAIYGILLAILLVAVAFAYVRHNVLSRLKTLTTGARLIGDGNLAHRIGLAITDEIGALAADFDDMAAHLQETRGLIEKRLQERDAAIQELEAFCYTVSHDLRTPLRAVDGFAQLAVQALEPDARPETKHYLERVREGAQRMGNLIDDLLAFSRLGRRAISIQEIASEPLVQECLQSLRNEYDLLKTQISINPIAPCQGDHHLLKQVWINLLSNALKFTGKTADAKIEIGSTQQHGETVYSVRDNGVGFDMRYADKLFGVFQRLHGIAEFPGTGVGLAIVQRIIKQHGGRIWAEAAPGQGATFFFTLGSVQP